VAFFTVISSAILQIQILSLDQEPEERPDVLSSDEEPSSSSEDEDSPKRRKKSQKLRGRPPLKFEGLVAASAVPKPLEVVAVVDSGVGGNCASVNGLKPSPPQHRAALTATAIPTVAAAASKIFDFEEKNDVEREKDEEECLAAAALLKKRGRPLGSKNRSKSRAPHSHPERKLSVKAATSASTNECSSKHLLEASPPPTGAINKAALSGSRMGLGASGKKSDMGGRNSVRQHLSFTLAQLGPKMNDLTRRQRTAGPAGVTSRRLSESSDDSSVVLSSGESSPRACSAERDSDDVRSSSPPVAHEDEGHIVVGHELTPQDEEITALDCEEVELVEEVRSIKFFVIF